MTTTTDAPDEQPNSRFARLLSSYLTAQRLSQAELGRLSGLHRSTVHRWESGATVHPTYRANVLRVADALKLSRAHTNELLLAASLDPLASNLQHESDPHLPVSVLARWVRQAPTNLPSELTSFVGRAEEGFALSVQVAGGAVRVLTLTGPGGVGKTRLALHVARGVLDVFSDGVYLVDLAPLANVEQVGSALLRAVGLRETSAQPPLDRMRTYLARRCVLLVLDNCEHLPAVADMADQLLRSAAGLTLLVTSRERLRLSYEHVHEVSPLPVPDANATPSELRDAPAIELLHTRARQQTPLRDVSRVELRAAAALCRWLEGLPLAIELAAARLCDVQPDQLQTQLQARLELASDARDLPARQRSLRATIAWSVELLTPEQRALFRSLAVFAGSWDTCAAAHVHGSELDATAAALTALADASLIQHAGAGPTARWRMLETIREYAGELLAERGAEDALRGRQLAHFLELAEAAPPYVQYPPEDGWHRRMDADYDNIRAVLAWSSGQSPDQFARLAAALWPYWHEGLRAQEGWDWIEAALEQTMPDERTRARLLNGALYLGSTLGHYRASAAHGQAALAYWRVSGDRHAEALTLQRLALIEYTTGNLEPALELAEQAFAAWKQVALPAGLAFAHGDLGFIYTTLGRFEQAHEHLTYARRYYEAHGAWRGALRAMTDQGLAAQLSFDITGAIALLTAAVEYGRELPNNFILPATYFYLGTAYFFAGDLDPALEHERQSLLLRRDAGDPIGMAYNLLAFAAIAHRIDHAPLAAQFCGAVAGILERTQIALYPTAQAIYAEELEQVQRLIGVDEFQRQFELGRSLELDVVTDAALRIADERLAAAALAAATK